MLPQCDCILLNAAFHWSRNCRLDLQFNRAPELQLVFLGLVLYHFIAGNGAVSDFQLFDDTSLNLLIHQTVLLPGKKTVTILCIFQDCLLRKLLKLVWL